MTQYIIKTLISAILIVAVAEISKRSSFIGALLASLPLVSVLAMIWLYIDTKDTEKVASLATSIFWLVLPSLSLFITLPMLLRAKVNFYFSLGVSALVMLACYGAMLLVLKKFGIKV
jgi:hypothetical protein